MFLSLPTAPRRFRVSDETLYALVLLVMHLSLTAHEVKVVYQARNASAFGAFAVDQRELDSALIDVFQAHEVARLGLAVIVENNIYSSRICSKARCWIVAVSPALPMDSLLSGTPLKSQASNWSADRHPF